MKSKMMDLAKIIGEEKMSVEKEDLEKFSHDASSHKRIKPDVVVYPESTSDVSKILSFANKNKIPVTPYGMGTSIEGNSIPVMGGILMSLGRMNRVINVYKNDFMAKVEPGIVGDDLNIYLAKYGLYFPAFAASSNIASLGGMIANNAGGMYAVKYGVVGDWILRMEVVLADGTVINVGSKSIKSVAGYDLKRLFIGSEGTLGIITKVYIRLISVIVSKSLYKVSFKNMEEAMGATVELLNADLDPAACELIDASSIVYLNKYKNAGWKEAVTILIEFHGDKVVLKDEEKIVSKIMKKNKCLDFYTAGTKEEQDKIWGERKCIYSGLMALFPGAGILAGDIGVPISAIVDFMDYVQKAGKKYNHITGTFGHAGDGNLHVWIVYEKADSSSFESAIAMNDELVAFAIKLGGTWNRQKEIYGR